MVEEICLNWFNDIFLEICGDAQQLLVCDRHKFNEAYRILETARENNARIIAFPLHTKHQLQPLDKNVFGPLSCYNNEACTEDIFATPLNTIKNDLSQNC